MTTEKSFDAVVNCIVKKYHFIIYQYLVIMNDSVIINQLDNIDNILQIGMNAITHIFKLNLLFYKNIDVAFFYSQKAYYCYLEYIEQINIKCITDDLNIKDAILFIYNKTLSRDALTNIHIQDASSSIHCHSNESTVHIENFDIIEHIFPEINGIVYYLLNFDNHRLTLSNRVILCEKYLMNYLIFFITNTYNLNVCKILEYLKIMNEKKEFSYETYSLFLEEFLKYICNGNNKKREANELFFLQYFNDNSKLTDYTKNEMKALVKQFFI